MKTQPKAKIKVRLSERRRRETYLSAALFVVAAVIVVGGIAYASRLPEVTIQKVTVNGANTSDPARIQASVEKIIDGTYALLIPKRMTYLVPRGALSASLVESFPEVASATVTRGAGNELIINVIEREAKALWCADTCYKMDAYGFVFDEALGTEVGLRHYEGLMVDPIGKIFLDGGFQDFDALSDRLATATGRGIGAVHLDSTDAVYRFTEGGELRVTRAIDPQKLLNDVTAIFASTPFQDGRSLLYVDLRFGTKAVAKFAD